MLYKKLKIKIILLITAITLTVCLCFGVYAVFPLKYYSEIVCVCKETNVEKSLILAIIKAESSFNAEKVSNKGAVGLMQLLPNTAEYISDIYFASNNFDLKNPKENILLGVTYIIYLSNKFDCQSTLIAAYNAGEGFVSEWLKDQRYSNDSGNLLDIPFPETENYLIKVNKAIEHYKNLYYKDKEN